jgi:hypothetical protein
MPRRLLALRVLSVSMLLLWAGGVRAELECAQPTVEKGEVRSGVPLSHRFVFINRGRDAVEITDVKPSCGCLAPKLEQRRLQPGESGTLLLEVNTLTQPEGANSWRVTIHYKTGNVETELPLYICARVVSEISVEPPSLAIYTDTTIGHEITVIDRRTEPLIVRSVPTSSPHVRSRLGELRRDAAGHWRRSIEVEVLASCPEGTHHESLRICTSDPTYPELKVPFTIVKRPHQQISAAPSSIVLANMAPGQPLPARIVLLSAADDREVQIERVDSDNAAIDCHWAQGPGRRATLKVRIDRSRITGDSLQSAVHVHLRGSTPETITIPVRCELR